MGFALFTLSELCLFLINNFIKFKDKNKKNLAAGLMFFIMFAFAAFRGSGDADYYNYLWFAKDIGVDFSKVLNFSYPVEFAFRLFSYLINILNLSRQWIIVIMNALSIIPVAYISIKKSANPFLSAIIFLPIFIQFDMQTARTATAIGLGLLSIDSFVSKKFFKSLLFFLFAMTFHRASVILLPFLFFMAFDIGRFFKILTAGAALLASVFSSLMFRILAQILSAIGLGRMATKVLNYTFTGQFAGAMKFYDPRIIFAAALFITTLMYFKKEDFEKFSLEEASIKAMWFALLVLLVFRSSTAIAFRFSTFFTILEIIYIPLVLEKVKNIDKLGKFLIALAVVFFLIPYAIFLMAKAPSYDFFFTNLNAIHSLK
ncbi:EpsG family protein [Anaerococcus sp. mt242]|uniref:EpsG family protein n=1 Tax=Anaerococcus sp. mt242 TaxID=2661917 RepID=UPI0019348B29|nr:EpsG family protein [Anaerococcus sp. mt242]MBM0046058.1 EpsG family protein [Anaerococcus sp. mt242]